MALFAQVLREVLLYAAAFSTSFNSGREGPDEPKTDDERENNDPKELFFRHDSYLAAKKIGQDRDR
jgi:hypothetical protein